MPVRSRSCASSRAMVPFPSSAMATISSSSGGVASPDEAAFLEPDRRLLGHGAVEQGGQALQAAQPRPGAGEELRAPRASSRFEPAPAAPARPRTAPAGRARSPARARGGRGAAPCPRPAVAPSPDPPAPPTTRPAPRPRRAARRCGPDRGADSGATRASRRPPGAVTVRSRSASRRALPAPARQGPLQLEVARGWPRRAGARPRWRAARAGPRGGARPAACRRGSASAARRRGEPQGQPAHAERVEAGHPQVAPQLLAARVRSRRRRARATGAPARPGQRLAPGRVRAAGEDQLAYAGAAQLVERAARRPAPRRSGDSPVEASRSASPPPRSPSATAARKLASRGSSTWSSSTMPGVTTRVTSRAHDGVLARLLHLVADGDLEPLLQEPGHVAAGGVVGHPAHGDLAVALGARGERDLQRAPRR